MTKKLSLYEFVTRSNLIHDNKYDYSKSVYINKRSKIEIICNVHGSFWQNVGNHLLGKGCPSCGAYMTGHKQRYSIDEFVKKANIKHSYKYDYSKSIYLDSRINLEIICPKHGPFWQRASRHLDGHGCLRCRPQNYMRTTDEFILHAKKIRGNKYDYSKSIFNGMNEFVEIICSTHGSFWQNPANHLHLKTDCPKCANSGTSKKENKWLDICGIPNKNRRVAVKIADKKFIVDGIDYNNKTIYEFYGDFWHGNPQKFKPTEINNVNKFSFGHLYRRTIERENALKSAGYKIISIWESDFVYLV